MPAIKHPILAVKDRAVNAFDRPLTMATVEAAIRMYSTEVNREDRNNPFWLYPDDYDLYLIGLFNTTTGEIEPCSPKVVVRAKDLVRNPPSSPLPHNFQSQIAEAKAEFDKFADTRYSSTE